MGSTNAPIEIGTPPATPPSAIVRFMQHNQGGFVGEPTAPFSLIEFAAYLRLTSAEAQSVLNGYADDGLFTYHGLDAAEVEQWRLSRDGCYVCGKSAGHRLTKKELQASLDNLTALASSLLDDACLELSVGGRPIEGRPNGQLLIGLRVAHRPYTRTTDIEAMGRLCEALSTLPSGSFEFLVFTAETVPERLKQRKILAGPGSGETIVAGEDAIDCGEHSYRAALSDFLLAHGLTEDRRFFGVDDVPGIPSKLSWYLRSLSLPDAPIHCCKSPVRLTPLPDCILNAAANAAESAPASRVTNPRDFDRERSPSIVALEAEYFAGQGKFDAYVNREFIASPTRRYDLPSEERTRDGIIAAMGQLRKYYAESRQHEAHLRATRTPSRPDYLAVFDCLNFEQPFLVGFVRQPLSQQAAMRDLYGIWNRVLKGLKAPGNHLLQGGFNGAFLSLWSRPATEAEIQAYDALCNREGKSFRSLALFRGTQEGFCQKKTFGVSKKIGDIPSVLCNARLDDPIVPKLFIGRNWVGERHARFESGRRLFDVINDMPSHLRQHALARLVDAGKISMVDLASRAALHGSSDPIVNGTGFYDAWVFLPPDGSDWKAYSRGKHWDIGLSETEGVLTLWTRFKGELFTTTLGPLADEDRTYGQPYQGKLSSLLNFMRDVAVLRTIDVDSMTKAEKPLDFDSFVELLSEMIHGPTLSRRYYEDSDWTAWPYFQTPAAAEREQERRQQFNADLSRLADLQPMTGSSTASN